ncbi:hypothetical protein TWF718_000483 [Orbilia javanica]|uniref:Uncharacterized protein n=1 Tax=Orbilia javanica TaxID=47235 RepID=A0AAN8MX76_9PEZI
MVVFHQSAAKRRWSECLYSYHDWTVAHDWTSFAILSMDSVFTTLYFAISVFMTVYYFAMVDYLKEHAAEKEGLSTVIKLLRARAGVTIAMSYICLCAFFWLAKRLFITGSSRLLTEEVDRKYEIYLRMYAIIISVAILRVASFILACPTWYPAEIMEVAILTGEFVAQPLVRGREDKLSDFVVEDIVVYFWGWSFVFLITAVVSFIGFLVSPDFISFIIHPRTSHGRTKYEIFDLFFFTATQPFWTTVDFLLLLCEVFECFFLCIFELLCCRKPQPMSYLDEYAGRHLMGKIRSPRYYNEPKLSVTYYWAGRAGSKSCRAAKYIWHVIKTSVLGMWFGAKWWGMKVKWGIKLKTRASGMTVILGPYPTVPVRGRSDRGGVNDNRGTGSYSGQSNPGQADHFDDVELGEAPARERNTDM